MRPGRETFENRVWRLRVPLVGAGGGPSYSGLPLPLNLNSEKDAAERNVPPSFLCVWVCVFKKRKKGNKENFCSLTFKKYFSLKWLKITSGKRSAFVLAIGTCVCRCERVVFPFSFVAFYIPGAHKRGREGAGAVVQHANKAASALPSSAVESFRGHLWNELVDLTFTHLCLLGRVWWRLAAWLGKGSEEWALGGD